MRSLRNATLLLLFICIIGCADEKVYFKTLDTFPSGSAIEFIDGRIYLVGDDARNVLVMNERFQSVDSILLIEGTQYRMPKEEKPDLEAILKQDNESLSFLILGSGSFENKRNKAYRIHVNTSDKTEFDLEMLYSRFKRGGISDLNIEGATHLKEGFVLSNRGNLSNRKNQLIFLADSFWNNQGAGFNIATIISEVETNSFQGVSGLTYSASRDWLLLTISTENTGSAFEDGEIGKSYLWIIKNISSRKTQTTLKPDLVFDLEKMDPVFRGQKIESACILSEKNDSIELAMVADNDKGTSWLCKLTLELK